MSSLLAEWKLWWELRDGSCFTFAHLELEPKPSNDLIPVRGFIWILLEVTLRLGRKSVKSKFILPHHQQTTGLIRVSWSYLLPSEWSSRLELWNTCRPSFNPFYGIFFLLSKKKKKNICALYLGDLTHMFLEDRNICCQWQKPTPGINPGKRDECIVCQSQGIKCFFTVPICYLQIEALTALH